MYRRMSQVNRCTLFEQDFPMDIDSNFDFHFAGQYLLDLNDFHWKIFDLLLFFRLHRIKFSLDFFGIDGLSMMRRDVFKFVLVDE